MRTRGSGSRRGGVCDYSGLHYSVTMILASLLRQRKLCRGEESEVKLASTGLGESARRCWRWWSGLRVERVDLCLVSPRLLLVRSLPACAHSQLDCTHPSPPPHPLPPASPWCAPSSSSAPLLASEGLADPAELACSRPSARATTCPPRPTRPTAVSSRSVVLASTLVASPAPARLLLGSTYR